MILFLYKLKILRYVLGDLKYIVVRLFFFMISLYSSSITFLFLTYGPEHITESIPPSKTFSQLYLYSKWYYTNKSNLGYGIYFRVLLALSTPYLLRKFLLKSNKQNTFKSIKSKIKSFFNGRNNNVASLNHSKIDLQSINLIKQLLVQDIEQVIDTRLNDIFLSSQKNETNLQSINFIKQLLVQEIEQAIDQKLNDIFLNREKKD